jgi:hypothetical protein
MKYLKPFNQFINESAEPSYQELTPEQIEAIDNLSSDIEAEAGSRFDFTVTSNGHIRFESNQNVHDWMDLRVHGDNIRMYLSQIVILKPVFLQLEDMETTDIDRLVNLGLVDDIDDYLKIGDHYLKGFFADGLTNYWSKDVSFKDINETADYWFSIKDLGTTNIEDLAQDLVSQVEDWMNQDAIAEFGLQAKLDKEFPEYEEDEEDDTEYEDDEEETEED